MPIFDFRCTDSACGHEFEKLVASSNAKVECPQCGSSTEKQISAPAAPQFKGTGFYATDFKGK